MPYRKLADMPPKEVEVKEMNEKEMFVRIWTMVIAGVVTIGVMATGYNVFSTIHNNSTALLKAQIEATPGARDAAQARAIEAKALADKVMFEEMMRHPPK